MIYLILKMFVYLLFALLAGAGAGWVLRHLAAARQEEEMQRTLADARARVPQFESLIRSRDEQIKRLKEELKDKDVRINALCDDVREAESTFRDKERELKQLTARTQAVDLAAETENSGVGTTLIDGADVGFGTLVSAEDEERLSDEITRLERELATARAENADATAEAAAAEAEVITLKAELARKGERGSSTDSGEAHGAAHEDARTELAELERRLTEKAQEFERLNRDLEQEQRRVLELEKERELQNKSLQVLHQQLELERERGQRVAAG